MPENQTRKSASYFWTATMNIWYKVLQEDALKEIMISSLKHLSVDRKIAVSVPIRMAAPPIDGKEKPYASLLNLPLIL